MSLYSTLKARGNQSGVTVRPQGSDSYPPPPGTEVPWVLAQPNQDNLIQKQQLGWRNLGTIGDVYHRQLHGDHTPWSAGKVQGVVYADDTEEPSWVEDAILRLCRMDDYDTRWIHFFNINGSQYNYAGERVASSGDYHLHTSTREGFELTRHTLLLDCDRLHHGLPLLRGNTAMATDVNPEQNFKFWNDSWALTYFKDQPKILDGVTMRTWGPEGWAYGRRIVEESATRHIELTARLAAIEAKLNGADNDAIQAIVRTELSNLEGRLAERFAVMGGDIAARVTEQFGDEVGMFVATEFMDALERGRSAGETQ